MKKLLLAFVGGIIFTTLIAAGTASIMTVKPAKPISVVVTSLYQSNAPKWITDNVNKGYQLHSMCGTGRNSSTAYVTIVMVKY